MTDFEGVKDVARLLRSKFGDDVRLRLGTPQEWEKIESGWPERIAPEPFHVEQQRVEE